MTKRLFDIVLSLVLLVLLAPLWIGVIAWMVIKRDLPIFYVSERMKTTDRAFSLIKFRTMRPPSADEENSGVSGGDKSDRITPLGHALRSKRLDEVPQLINILKGDMSFVGPRPPLRQYTQSHKALYREVLKSKPGVTGLASLSFHRHEEFVLANAASIEETDTLYKRRCIPRKAAIDLIYQRHSNVCFDFVILWRTALKVLRR